MFRKKAVIRVSCLVSRENPLVAAWVALPGNASVTVDISFVCATDQASLDMRNRSSLLMPSRPWRGKEDLTCISHHPTVEAHDTSARTSLRLLAVLDVLFKHACARQARLLRLVLTALSRTSPRRVVRHAGQGLQHQKPKGNVSVFARQGNISHCADSEAAILSQDLLQPWLWILESQPAFINSVSAPAWLTKRLTT